MERHAAQAALSYIRDDMTIGLGSGKAVNYLIEFISMASFKNLKVVTNQLSTALAARERGLTLIPSSLCSQLDYTFDTLDYLISNQGGLKANTTVVCEDKVLASMAKSVVYMVDASHVRDVLDPTIPVEAEVVRNALSYVGRRLEEMHAQVYYEDPNRRQPILSAGGNYILEAAFPKGRNLKELDLAIRSIPGVAATSLFTDVNALMLVYDKDDVQVISNAEENLDGSDQLDTPQQPADQNTGEQAA